MPFYVMAAPISIPTHSAQGSPFLHMLSNTSYSAFCSEHPSKRAPPICSPWALSGGSTVEGRAADRNEQSGHNDAGGQRLWLEWEMGGGQRRICEEVASELRPG